MKDVSGPAHELRQTVEAAPDPSWRGSYSAGGIAHLGIAAAAVAWMLYRWGRR